MLASREDDFDWFANSDQEYGEDDELAEHRYLSETYTGTDSEHDDIADSEVTPAPQVDLSRVSTNSLLPALASSPLLTFFFTVPFGFDTTHYRNRSPRRAEEVH